MSSTCLPPFEGASGPRDAQLSQAVDQHVVQEIEGALRCGEAEFGKPFEERGDGQFRLYLRHRTSKAAVYSVAEGQMPSCVPRHVEFVGMREDGRVAVGRGQVDDDGIAF